MLRQIEWWVRNGPIKKNVVLPVTTLFFSKFCFSLITTSKEFIWCSSDSNLHIHTFYKRCSFIWQCFFPVSIVNKQFFCFGLVTSKLRSFCDQVNETVIHIFAECSATKKLLKKLIHYFRNTLNLPEILPQSAIFGFLLVDKKTFWIENLILLLFKIYIYKSRSSKALIFDSFLRKISKKRLFD